MATIDVRQKLKAVNIVIRLPIKREISFTLKSTPLSVCRYHIFSGQSMNDCLKRGAFPSLYHYQVSWNKAQTLWLNLKQGWYWVESGASVKIVICRTTTALLTWTSTREKQNIRQENHQ